MSVEIEFTIIDGEGNSIIYEKGNISSSVWWHLTNNSPTIESVASIYNSRYFELKESETYILTLRVLSGNMAAGDYNTKVFLTRVSRISSP